MDVAPARSTAARRRSPRPRFLAVAVSVAAAVILAACGAADDGAAVPSTTASAAPACPVAPIDVVVSVGQWGDIVEDLAGACADVTTVLASSTADPHDYEPTPGDVAKFAGADLVVRNGAFYDDWARRAVDAQPSKPVVIDAAAVTGVVGSDDAGGKDDDGHRHGDDEKAAGASADGDGHGGVNPHIWYDPAGVKAVAAAVTEKLKERAPGASAYFDQRAVEWAAAVQPYFDAVQDIRTRFGGTPYLATESVFDSTGDAAGLVNVTPERYRAAAANETEPSPADIAAFDAALRDGSAKVLVYNPQTEGAVTGQLRRTAEEAGVPVVEMTETVAPGASSFADWQIRQLRALSSALARSGAGS